MTFLYISQKRSLNILVTFLVPVVKRSILCECITVFTSLSVWLSKHCMVYPTFTTKIKWSLICLTSCCWFVWCFLSWSLVNIFYLWWDNDSHQQILQQLYWNIFVGSVKKIMENETSILCWWIWRKLIKHSTSIKSEIALLLGTDYLLNRKISM